MIKRRTTPDGLPFRLYLRKGKRTTSFGYKLPTGAWAFRISAPTANAAAVARAKKEAIEKANAINGDAVLRKSTTELITDYFEWQDAMPIGDERRKAASTLSENRREAKPLIAVFGKMPPELITKQHCYQYLDHRAKNNAPAKANKEIALLSAVMEYGVRTGRVKENPCRQIKYNPTRPNVRRVRKTEIDFVMQIARTHGGSYLRVALTALAAYLALTRPEETRTLKRSAITDDGLSIKVAKRKAGQAQKTKTAAWSAALDSVIKEALSLQKTASIYIFPNQQGQPYSRSGWITIWKRLMAHCKKADPTFEPFTLQDMRPSGYTDKRERGDQDAKDGMGHADENTGNKVYDRRRDRKYTPTE